MATSIKRQSMVDIWQTMVENGVGNTERIYLAVEDYMEKSDLPGVFVFRDDVRSSFFGETREFVISTLGLLPDYKMFLCVRDFGQHLDCARFMTCRASMFKKMVSKYAAGSPNALSMNLNVFSQQELTAWQHIVHQAFVNAIKDLMADLDQDISRLNMQSKGYLSVW